MLPGLDDASMSAREIKKVQKERLNLAHIIHDRNIYPFWMCPLTFTKTIYLFLGAQNKLRLTVPHNE